MAEASESAPGEELFNPTWVIVIGVCSILLLLTAYAVWTHRNAPPERPRKKVGAKKAKREKLRQGLQPAGE